VWSWWNAAVVVRCLFLSCVSVLGAGRAPSLADKHGHNAQKHLFCSIEGKWTTSGARPEWLVSQDDSEEPPNKTFSASVNCSRAVAVWIVGHRATGNHSNHHFPPPNIAMIGDSTMGRLTQKVHDYFFPDLKLVRSQETLMLESLGAYEFANLTEDEVHMQQRCFYPEYLGVMDAYKDDRWIPPTICTVLEVAQRAKEHCGIGPVLHQERHGCSAGQSSMLFATGGSSPGPTLEFVGSFFAKDVTIQSPMFNTSQQAVTAYLRRRTERIGRKLDLCVVNAGIHDFQARIDANLTVEYTLEFMRALQPLCHRILRLQTSACVCEPRFRQNNTDTMTRNAALKVALAVSSNLCNLHTCIQHVF